MLNQFIKYGLLLFTAFGLVSSAMGQVSKIEADKICGVWINASGSRKIKIQKEGNTYSAVIHWLKNPTNSITGLPMTDINNPDFSKKNLPLLGLKVFHDFSFNVKKHSYVFGIVYNPDTGKEYEGLIKWVDENTIIIREYVFFSMFGSNNTWRRSK